MKQVEKTDTIIKNIRSPMGHTWLKATLTSVKTFRENKKPKYSYKVLIEGRIRICQVNGEGLKTSCNLHDIRLLKENISSRPKATVWLDENFNNRERQVLDLVW